MPDQELERLRDRLKNKFNRFLHSLVPARTGSRSPSHSIRSTRNAQASSTHVADTQPLNSPSLSNYDSNNIYTSFVIDPAGDEAPGRMAELASAGFQGVKTTLRLVERATDVFPPLKSTVAGLLGVIDIVEVCDFNSVS